MKLGLEMSLHPSLRLLPYAFCPLLPELLVTMKTPHINWYQSSDPPTMVIDEDKRGVHECKRWEELLGHRAKSAPTIQTKVSFHRFAGDDLRGWLYRSETFFEQNGTPGDNKVMMAAVHLEGQTLQWHQIFMLKRMTRDMPRWEEYVQALHTRFGATALDDSWAERVTWRQTGEREECLEKLDSLAGWKQSSRASKIPLQVGFITLGFMNDMLVSTRISSVYPNWDEQSNDGHDPIISNPPAPLPVAPKQQLPKNMGVVEETMEKYDHDVSKAKKEQFSGSNQQIQSQGFTATAIQYPISLPIPPEVQQMMFVPGLLPHAQPPHHNGDHKISLKHGTIHPSNSTNSSSVVLGGYPPPLHIPYVSGDSTHPAVYQQLRNINCMILVLKENLHKAHQRMKAGVARTLTGLISNDELPVILMNIASELSYVAKGAGKNAFNLIHGMLLQICDQLDVNCRNFSDPVKKGSGPPQIDYGHASNRPPKDVVVSRRCAEAVLRGAQVFVPGVMGCSAHVEKGDEVTVSVDVEQHYPTSEWRLHMTRGMVLQGRQTERNGLYIGQGIAKMSRAGIFRASEGVAIDMTNRAYRLPSFNDVREGELFLQTPAIQKLGSVLNVTKTNTFPLPLLSVAHQQLILATSIGLRNNREHNLLKICDMAYGVEIACAANAEMYHPEQLAQQIISSAKIVNRIGFIGFGAMGYGMSTNLLKSNFSVTGYDVFKPSLARFTEAGILGNSPAEISKDVEVLVLMVTNEAQVGSVLFGDSSAIAALVNGRGLKLVDTPVSGGVKRAAEGTLTIMASDSDESLRLCLGIFRT